MPPFQVALCFFLAIILAILAIAVVLNHHDGNGNRSTMTIPLIARLRDNGDDSITLNDTGTRKFNTKMVLQLPLEKVAESGEYRCAGFDLRNMSLNVIGWSTRPTSTKLIHHMTMYLCPNLGEKQTELILQDGGGKTWRCEHSTEICGQQAKQKIEFGPGFENMEGNQEAPGDMYFPDNAVLPMGMNTTRRFAVIQVHNNAPIDADQSGFQLMLSSNPMPDRNQLQYFQMVWDLTRRVPKTGIPPLDSNYQIIKEWTVPTEKGRNGPFIIFGAHLHYHSIGKRMTLEYARKKKMVVAKHVWRVLAQRIGNHSKTIFLDPVVKLKGGDRLRATVVWDSSKRMINTPFGMDAFDNEMADVFIQCYATLENPVGCIEGCEYLPR